ncbi:MAG: Gfo/Idh/MocA family oxidoreductase [Rhodothermales bacterium]
MPDISDRLNRRSFLKASATATAATSLAWLPSVLPGAYATGSDTLKVGLIGCGGRGSGAARDCVTSAEGVQLVAMADLFRDRLDRSREALEEALGEAYNVSDDHCFDGFDGYKRVLETDVDIVILATPPGFRPLHIRAALEAGKHVFAEKPVATDVAGAKSAIASGQLAREKGLALVTGTQYRRQPSYVDAIQRIHNGMIGDVLSAEEYYLTGSIWLRPRKPDMTDLEWQCRNWYYFTWLSGDHIVEQFVHNLDTINWALQANPVKALGMGGRLTRTSAQYGHIYDHFSIEYEYPNGARVTAMCRQMEGAHNQVSNRIVGTLGVADVNPGSSVIRAHDGRVLFEAPERGNNPYVQEHTDLVNSIRSGTPIVEVEETAYSTLTGILGRESAYTGQALTWDEVMNAEQDLLPADFSVGALPEVPVPLPGKTNLARKPFHA